MDLVLGLERVYILKKPLVGLVGFFYREPLSLFGSVPQASLVVVPLLMDRLVERVDVVVLAEEASHTLDELPDHVSPRRRDVVGVGARSTPAGDGGTPLRAQSAVA